MSTLRETVEDVLAARELAEKVAAAREEQREVDARVAEDYYRYSERTLADDIRATPLTFTPLADRIKEQSLTIETLGESNARLLRERDEAAADLATATSLAKTLTEERDAAEAVQQTQEDRARELIAEADARAADLAALASALRDELNATRTAHAATVAWVVAVRDELLTPLAQVSTEWGATADGFGQATVKILVALEVKP